MRVSHRLFLYVALLAMGGTAMAGPDHVDAMRATTSGQLTVAMRSDGDTARFVRSTGDLAPHLRRASADTKVRGFLDQHGSLLGIDNPRQLRLLRSRADNFGTTTFSYEQTVNGVPVFGARINANLDAANALRSVNGDFEPGLMLNTRPQLRAAQARRIALKRVAASRPAPGLSAQQPQLYIYRQPLRASADGPAVLAWQVEVGNDNDVREFVMVNAVNGKIVDQYTGIHEALNRRVYNGGFSAQLLVWSEGDPTPYGDPAIDDLIGYTEDTYYLFANLTGNNFLSWDGAGSIMNAVNNDPGITCPNATWNGVSINFCSGTTSDDVVGHEWAHGYTQSTHGLIYRWQSGALNESYSDIFGEAVDQLNAAGADTPAALRSVGSCSTFGGTAPPGFEVLTPASIAGGYSVAGAAFNPATADVTADVVAAEDGVGASTDGCESLTNSLSGAIALIDRGSCDFTAKVLNAQAAGAIGVVIANNAGNDLVFMGGSAPGITIPSVFVSQTDGESLRGAAGLTARLNLGGAGENSLRWLMGEDASGFGGAIRDLWNPQCYGDPGRVSDGEYFCNGEVDGGGVHTNSGVPNHAFALLVDGGTYNGYTINSIGMNKALNIYWRAASVYQTPTTDFADHADSLEASCADLIGSSLTNLGTQAQGGGESGLAITAADCTAVAAAIAATELRLEPVQCNFNKLLDTDAPDLCAQGSSAQTIFAEDFEAGLNNWTAGTREILNPATFSGPDWTTSSDLPTGRSGTAAYGPNLVLGNCSNDIESGIIYLESPAINLPAGIDAARMAFDHSVATEADYDGANIKVSVNGGPWQLLPASAFTFNAYNGSLVSSDNPMAGEPAFNGTDEGSLSSGWGQSQVNFSGVAAAGDSVRLRFEVGMDGCNGLLGWFIDDVQLYSCAAAADDDNDGLPNSADNCTAVSNPNQVDSDGDGYGNFCDADLDNTGLVDLADLALFRTYFLTTPSSGNWTPAADLNSDGTVDLLDLGLVRQQFLSAPGPSGVL
ncbi:MAG: M4 family metallopeptidase [Gammaproteobacteria bacterium]|nr:M4 family metallopeptidase [Gammaproteobacteria bacterium]NNM20482.1 hypothetical protein [Gammaproteobacteria bacterium]